MNRTEMIAAVHLLLGLSPLLCDAPAWRRIETVAIVLNNWGPHGPAVKKAVIVCPTPPLPRVMELAEKFFGAESGGFGVVIEADAEQPI